MHVDMDAVVVTHNSAEDIRFLIASQATVSSFRRVIVIDNASSDETCSVALDGGLEVVPQSENRGLAAAANLGARQTEGPCFALLNPDIRFWEPGDLARLEQHLSDPNVGAVAPALVLPNGEIQDSARRVPTPVDLLLRRFIRWQPDAVRASRPIDVEWAVAACLLIRRDAFERIGGLDERYFLYFEDVDLGVRLAGAGYSVRYDPTVRVFHRHRAASRSSLISPSTRQHIRSAFKFYAGHPRHLFHTNNSHRSP
jgi:N-acetylglucosaminyl-diphospho-decaprenol L-rhamnosyltransferase